MARRVRLKAVVGRKVLRGSFSGDYRQSQMNVRASMAQVISNYQKLVDALGDSTPEILLEALEPTFEKSQEYCPEDTGRLKSSGYLEITQFRGTPTVEIGYGRGGQPEYTVAVHENLEWRHKAPTRAKWLEVALTEDDKEIEQRIASAYKEMFA